MQLNTASRAWKPLPPGNVTLNGVPYESWPSNISGDATLSWSHRNRVTQGPGTLLVPQDVAGAYALEGSVTVEVLVGGVMKRSWPGLTSTSKIYTEAQRRIDDADPTKPVQFRIKPVNGTFTGTVRTTPEFTMVLSQAFGAPDVDYPPIHLPAGVANLNGLAMMDTNTFVVVTSQRHDTLNLMGTTQQRPPSRLITVTSAGISNLSGSSSLTGLVNGDAGASRFLNSMSCVVDSSGNFFVIDNDSALRRIDSSGNATTWLDLSAYAGDFSRGYGHLQGAIGSLTIDASDNLYVFTNYTRQILKITPAKAISILAGGWAVGEGNGTLVDGTGTSARFSFGCQLAADAVGNLFVQELVGGGVFDGTLRYCTAAGVVTTLKDRSGEGIGQMAVIGSDVYYSGYFDRYFGDGHLGVNKCTPAGVVSTLVRWVPTMGAPGAVLGIAHLSKDPGGFLAFCGYGPTQGNPLVGKISSGGVISQVWAGS
ncbi:hypothetical protein [Geothrix sp. PMB-07]|uniref:hypothetical protein n=1 Tax=Geothrix sp. PMB-07 TaxID=3068640 RepID=UPI002741A53A|nr:hypothetical protein [Geothrix sp. PMB-07]WLT30768.1 hypothetical protein Q9293_13690 [Geothrix sp. PMB-07]WLT32272.1 hypothetical protein Q9293_02855 [Geothrix sp. PMB-07]